MVDVDHYEEFSNIQELVNFVAGTGSYEDRNSFMPNKEDRDNQRLEMKQAASPQCPHCIDEINEYLLDGAMRSEVDIDPYMNVNIRVGSEEAQFNDERKTGYAVAYCDNEDHQDTFFRYEESWFE